MERKLLYKYILKWLCIGFVLGCILYGFMKYILNMDVWFWLTTVLVAGNCGFFMGGYGGFIRVCQRNQL